MKFIQLAKSTIDELKLSAIRFPLPVLFALTMFLFALNGIYNWDLFPEGKEDRIASVIIAGFFWFGGAKLFAESRKLSAIIYLGLSIPIFLALSSYIYYGHYGSSVLYFIISGLIVFVTVAPFLNKKSTDSGFYNFNRKLWVGFAYSILLAIIFCAGFAAIVATIKELFAIDLNYKIYTAIWTFGYSFLAPFYALSWVSRDFNSQAEAHIPKGIKFILTYILVPFGVIYTIILYAYAAKILLEWQLPQGKLSYMICGFGAAGSIIQLASYPIRNTGGTLIRFFHKYFCRAFLPLIILLFIAIGVRINEYGITEGRYAIILAGVWFSAVTTIFIIRKDNNSMKFGPAILSALLLLASFGPWGAVDLSAKSQVARLEALLIKHNILQNGKVVKTTSQVDEKDRGSISSITDYLARTEKLDEIKPWFEKGAAIHTANRWSGYQIQEDFGISYGASQDRFTFYRGSNNDNIEVRGYDYYKKNISSYSYDNCAMSCDKISVHISDKHFLVINQNNAEMLKVDLLPLLDKLKTISEEDKTKASDNMLIETENDKYKAKIIFNELYGDYDNKEPNVSNAKFDLLYKVK